VAFANIETNVDKSHSGHNQFDTCHIHTGGPSGTTNWLFL